MFVPLWMCIAMAASAAITVIVVLVFHAIFSDL